MMKEIKIFTPTTADDFAAVHALLSEYMTFIFALPDMDIYIDPLQANPLSELDELQTGKYAPPEGTILLATHDDTPIGVIAVRKFKGKTCEMKRLYVRPILRGASVGRKLAEMIVEKGREMGYDSMVLDSHYTMTSAHRLYESLGFQYIDCYNDNPVPRAVFMELKLNR